MFVYEHTETIRKVQTSWVNDLRILRNKNAKFSGYYLCVY